MGFEGLKLPLLEAYRDYRQYIRDIIMDPSLNLEKIPLQRFAQAFGLGRSHLTMVLAGTRSLTIRHIHDIAYALHLDHEAHEYWESLVLYGQSKEDMDRTYYLKRMDQVRFTRKTRSINVASKTLVSQWYIPAILVYLLDINCTKEHRKKLAQRLEIDPETLERTITQLELEGFLSFREAGSIHISFNRIVTMVSNRNYLKKVFEVGIHKMENHFDSKICLFDGTTFSISQEDIHFFIAEYKQLLDRYCSVAGQSQDRVVQANIQFFPVI